MSKKTEITLSILAVVFVAIVLVVSLVGITKVGVNQVGENPPLGCVPQSILTAVEGKTGAEKIALASKMIVNDSCFTAGVYVHKGVRVEIRSIEVIDGGIAVVARAWADTVPIEFHRTGKDKVTGQEKDILTHVVPAGDKIGFSPDGSVEWETIRIIDPPYTVPDPVGLITKTYYDPVIKGDFTERAREDAIEAILVTLSRGIKSFGKEPSKIVLGKVGHTITGLYSGSGAGVAPVDGDTLGNDEATWALARSNGSAAGPTSNSGTYHASKCGALFCVFRGIHSFDGQQFPSGTVVASSTFIFVARGSKTDTNAVSLTIQSAENLVSTTTIATGDHDAYAAARPVDTQIFGSSTLAALTATDGFANSLVLDANGRAFIQTALDIPEGTANSDDIRFMIRFSNDNASDGTTYEPTGNNLISMYFVEAVALTNRPSLWIDESVPVVATLPIIDSGVIFFE